MNSSDPYLCVLMTADTVGGVWSYCVDLTRILGKRNVLFHVVTSGARITTQQRKMIESAGNVAIYETEFKLEWMQDSWNDVEQSGFLLLELEQKIRPDIIHLNSFSYASLPFLAPKIVVAHSDVFSWWQAVKQCSPDNDWQEYFEKVKRGIHHSDCVVPPSQAMLGSLSSIYGKNPNTRMIYNGRDEGMFSPGLKKPLVACAGRLWDEGKNASLLTRAASDINGEVIIAGIVDREFDISNNVTLAGKVDAGEIANILSSARVYAAPARYEPFGLAILEAALSGCALVLGDIPSLREIWKDAAVFIDTDSPAQLANACNRFLSDPDEACRFGNMAMERAKLFSLENMGEQYYRLYRQLEKGYFKSGKAKTVWQ